MDACLPTIKKINWVAEKYEINDSNLSPAHIKEQQQSCFRTGWRWVKLRLRQPEQQNGTKLKLPPPETRDGAAAFSRAGRVLKRCFIMLQETIYRLLPRSNWSLVRGQPLYVGARRPCWTREDRVVLLPSSSQGITWCLLQWRTKNSQFSHVGFICWTLLLTQMPPRPYDSVGMRQLHPDKHKIDSWRWRSWSQLRKRWMPNHHRTTVAANSQFSY